MTITISNSRETGVSVYQFASHAPKWREAARMEPGKPRTLDVETEEPALIVTWRRVRQGYQVEQIKVARTRNQGFAEPRCDNLPQLSHF